MKLLFDLGIVSLILYTLYLISIESGVAVSIYLLLITIYAYIGIHGNSLYTQRLSDIIKDLHKTIHILSKRL